MGKSHLHSVLCFIHYRHYCECWLWSVISVCDWQVHNSRSCEGSVYSCSRALSLFFPNEEEIYISGYQVVKGGHRWVCIYYQYRLYISFKEYNSIAFVTNMLNVAFIKKKMVTCVFFCSDWVSRRPCVMFSSSAWPITSWWRARLASLWRGTGALESTSKWPMNTKESLVVCVETIMMTDRMISAAAAVRQTGPDTHLSFQSAANSGQLYQNRVEPQTQTCTAGQIMNLKNT